MRVFIKVIILFIGYFGFSQSSPTNNNPSLPNFIPPSPSSYEMTKYGSLPVNEYIGVVNNSIPFYTYKVEDIELPISIENSTGAVKVDQSCSWTGIGWRLNAGGVINRTINDIADEMYSLDHRLSLDNIPSNAGYDGSSQANFLISLLENNDRDSEADIFNFSLPNYSGSFFLDKNLVPRLVKNDKELKIEIVGSLLTNQEFRIITPEGLKYYFGGVNNIETEGGTSQNPCTSCGRALTYYLTRIESPKRGTISFEYETLNTSCIISKSRNYGILLSTDENVVDKPECWDTPPPPEHKEEFGFTAHYINTKFLKKIKNDINNEIIEFETENKNIGNSYRILNNVVVKNKINVNDTYQTTNNFSLSYIGTETISNYKRFFLSEIKINNQLSTDATKIESYKMEYNNPLYLPDRLSFAQDYFGYYNGKENNESSLPLFNYYPFNQYSSYMATAADRNSNFELALIGSLTKITYPTKGYTTFEYEGAPFKEKVYTDYYGRASLSTTGADLTENQVPRYSDEMQINYVMNPIFENQLVNITVNISNDIVCATPNHNLKTKLIIENLTDVNSTPDVFTQNNGYTGGSVNIAYTFLKDKLYKVKVEFESATSNCTSSPLQVNFNFSLFTGFVMKQGTSNIRIKRVIDYAKNNEVSNYKRFYYNPLRRIASNLSFENLPYEPKPKAITNGYAHFVGKRKAVSPIGTVFCSQNFYGNFAQYIYINSNGINNFYSHSDINVNPITTISYGGDNFENGGVEKVYSKGESNARTKINSLTESLFDTNGFVSRFSNKVNNEKQNSGDLIQEIIFEKKNNQFYKKEQTNYNYLDSNENVSNYFVNISGQKVYDQVYFGENQDPFNVASNYYIVGYLTKSFNSKLLGFKKSSYFEDCIVPDIEYNNNLLEDEGIVLTEDALGVKKITTTQSFEYGTLRGLPTVITTNTSDSSIVNKTVNTYVNTASTLPNIPNNQGALYTSLIAQNRVGSPVQVQQFQNSELLSTQRTLYNNFTVNSVTKILPEKIQIGKGDITVNPLEDKAIFYNYDANFNPVVMGYANAPKTRYMFNTDGLVVAKIENYTGTATSFPLITGNIDNTNCALQTQYPDSFVTVFTYNLITKKLIQTTDSRCQNSFYEYDALHRLKLIKDHDGNIIKEYDQQFKPQN